MAESVTIRSGDTLNQLLKCKRGVEAHRLQEWLKTISVINPHISDLNRIYPGEFILIPDTLNENVPRHMIWQNAFNQVPQALKQLHQGADNIYFVQAGDSIDSVARFMFSSGPHRTMPLSSKRALLIHNNPFLETHLFFNNCLNNGRLPAGMILNITPVMLGRVDRDHWLREMDPMKNMLAQLHDDTRDMFKETGPEPTLSMAEIVELLESWGASVGADDVIRVASYGTAGVSGHAAAGTVAMGTVNSLLRELYGEAIEKFGPKIVHSKKANDLAKVQRFLKNSPKYQQVMAQLRELPKHLMPKGKFMAINTRTPNAAARHFRKQVSIPMKKWSSSRYMGTMAKQLNGRLRLAKGVGRYATWYVPAALGAISVATAPPEMRVRTLFEEGFGVLGGAAGTYLGTFAGLGIIAILGLGPLGAFIAIFLCASAGGMLGMELFKSSGRILHDVAFDFDGRYLYSADEFVGVFNE